MNNKTMLAEESKYSPKTMKNQDLYGVNELLSKKPSKLNKENRKTRLKPDMVRINCKELSFNLNLRPSTRDGSIKKRTIPLNNTLTPAVVLTIYK